MKPRIPVMVPSDLVVGSDYIRRKDGVEVRIEKLTRTHVEFVTRVELLVYAIKKASFLKLYRRKPFRIADVPVKEEPTKMPPNVLFRSPSGEDLGSILISDLGFGAFQKGDFVHLPNHRNLEVVERHVNVRTSDSKLTLTLVVKS